MKTSFAKFEPFTLDLTNDHQSFYHIEVFDNGIRWELQLVHTLSCMVYDSLNLEYRISLSSIDPIWHDHKVIRSPFNRDDWNADAPEETIEFIKARCEVMNQMSLEDFILDHNIETIEHERIMIAAAENKPINIEDYAFWGEL